jgi:hypothetical protein
VHRAVLVALLVALLAASGCGGGTSKAETPVEAVDALVDAAAAGEDLTPLVTTSSQAHADELARLLRPFGDGHSVFLDSLVEQWAVVGIADEGTEHAAAVVLREEDGEWRAEVTDRILVDPTGPRPGSVQPVVAQVAAELHARSAPLGPSAMWVDDGGVELKGATSDDGKTATIFANLAEPVPAGRHAVVALATAGNTAAARGWAFGVAGS